MKDDLSHRNETKPVLVEVGGETKLQHALLSPYLSSLPCSASNKEDKYRRETSTCKRNDEEHRKV